MWKDKLHDCFELEFMTSMHDDSLFISQSNGVKVRLYNDEIWLLTTNKLIPNLIMNSSRS